MARLPCSSACPERHCRLVAFSVQKSSNLSADHAWSKVGSSEMAKSICFPSLTALALCLLHSSFERNPPVIGCWLNQRRDLDSLDSVDIKAISLSPRRTRRLGDQAKHVGASSSALPASGRNPGLVPVSTPVKDIRGRFRSPGVSSIWMDRRRGIEERLHDPPGFLDAVLPHKANALADDRRMEHNFVGSRLLIRISRELNAEINWLSSENVDLLHTHDESDSRRWIETDDDLI